MRRRWRSPLGALLATTTHVKAPMLAAALCSTLVLHLVMQTCISGRPPLASLAVTATAAARLIQSQLGGPGLSWPALSLALNDFTVKGSAEVSRALAGMDSRVQPAADTAAKLAAVPEQRPRQEQQGQFVGTAHAGGTAPGLTPDVERCAALLQDLAGCSSQAHKCTQQLDHMLGEARLLQLHYLSCASELLRTKARAAAAGAIRLWATASTSACVLLVLQLRGRRQVRLQGRVAGAADSVAGSSPEAARVAEAARLGPTEQQEQVVGSTSGRHNAAPQAAEQPQCGSTLGARLECAEAAISSVPASCTARTAFASRPLSVPQAQTAELPAQLLQLADLRLPLSPRASLRQPSLRAPSSHRLRSAQLVA